MSGVTNFVQLTRLIATSGQPTRTQFAQIADQDYAVVINLAMADSKRAIPEEGSIVTSLGMSYIHIPVPFDAPSIDQLRQFIGILKGVEGKPVWVHCVRNRRVSAFMYHYLKLEKKVPESACRSVMFEEWLPVTSDECKAY